MFVSQAVERLPLTPPPPGSLSFPFSFAVSLSLYKPPPLAYPVSLVFSPSLFSVFLTSGKQPLYSSIKRRPAMKSIKTRKGMRYDRGWANSVSPKGVEEKH